MRTEDDLRAALTALERHTPDLAAVLPQAPEPARGRPRRPVQWRWLRTAAPVLVAFAVVAAVVTPLTVGKILSSAKRNVPGVASGSAAVNPAAAAALTAAAKALAAQPAQSGAYFRVSGYLGATEASGPNAHPYITDARDFLSTTWYPRQANAKPVSYTSNGGDWDQASALPTPGALAAWRAAGQPPLPHKPAKVVSHVGSAGDFGSPSFVDHTLTAAQFLALPTNPAALLDVIRAAIRRSPDDMIGIELPSVSTTQRPSARAIPLALASARPRPKPGSTVENQRVFLTCVALLERDPISPATRAATLGVLATLPGLTFDQHVTDRLGRTGFGISMPGVVYNNATGLNWGWATPEGTDMKTVDRLRLVISPAGTLLDEEDVTTSPSLSTLRVMPPSGAIPGPAKCPAGLETKDVRNGLTVCVTHGEVVQASGPGFTVAGGSVGSPGDKPPVYLNRPILAIPAGTVLSYRAILGAGWTNDTPSAAASAQAIPGS